MKIYSTEEWDEVVDQISKERNQLEKENLQLIEENIFMKERIEKLEEALRWAEMTLEGYKN